MEYGFSIVREFDRPVRVSEAVIQTLVSGRRQGEVGSSESASGEESMTETRERARGLFLALIMVTSVMTAGVAFSGSAAAQQQADKPGDAVANGGTAIYDWYDLNQTRDDLDADYTLENDLDETTPGYNETVKNVSTGNLANGGSGFVPIGLGKVSNRIYYSGTFDGDGHTISDLYINADSRFAGLFPIVTGKVEDLTVADADVDSSTTFAGTVVGNFGGTIQNVNVTNSDVTAEGYTGGLVGALNGGSIQGVSVSGSGTVESDPDNSANEHKTGGIAGAAVNSGGTIANSETNITVKGARHVGGVVGFLQANNIEGVGTTTITDSKATGRVEGTSLSEDGSNYANGQNIGGLVGSAEYTGALVVEESFTTATVKGTENVGGLLGNDVNGRAGVTIKQSYSVANIKSDGGDAQGNIGGLVGKGAPEINNSYAVPTITTDVDGSGTGADDIGGVIGTVNGQSETDSINTFWNTERTGFSSAVGDGNLDATGLTTSEMQGAEATVNMAGFNFSTNWTDVANDYPELRTFAENQPISIGDTGYGTIQGAINNAESGDTIEVEPGAYVEEVKIDEPLTLESKGTAAETKIRLTQEEASSTGAPTVDILSPGVTVDGFTIQRNSTGNFAQGIRVSNGSESGDTVVVSNNTVENLNTTRSVDNGILVGDNNAGDTPANVIVHSNTVSEFPNGIGVTSKTSGEVVKNVTVRNNTLYGNQVGFGVSNVSGAGVESIEATQNNITQNGVGVYLFGEGDSGLPFTDVNASEVSAIRNDIVDNGNGELEGPSGVVNNGTNSLNATSNWWGASSGPSGQGPGSGTEVSSNVTFEPFYIDAAKQTLRVDVNDESVENASRTNVGGDGSATVTVGGRDVQSTTVTLPSGSSATSVTVGEASAPTGSAQGSEPENDVATYLNVSADSEVDDSVDISVTVEKSTLSDAGIATEDAVILHYVDGAWTELETTPSTGGGTVTLTATATGLSPFAVGAAAADPAGGGSDTGSLSGEIAAGDTSVTERISLGPVREVTVGFAEATTGSVRIERVDGFPVSAPTPDRQVLSTIDIAPPAEAANAPGSVEVTISRTAVSDAGTSPSELRFVRYDESDDELETLNTDVVSADEQTIVLSADTPGFSVFGVVVAEQTTATATPTATTTPGPTATVSRTETATPTRTPVEESTSPDAATETPTPTEGSGPGFGAIVAVLSLIAAALLAGRRDE